MVKATGGIVSIKKVDDMSSILTIEVINQEFRVGSVKLMQGEDE